MTIKICVLGSGSSGNCTAIWTNDDALLIDCGRLSYRYVMDQLAGIKVPPSRIRGIVFTHGHSDHIDRTALRMASAHAIPMYLHKTIFNNIRDRFDAAELEQLQERQLIRHHPARRFTVGSFEVVPFATHHRMGCVTKSLGFCISHRGARIGYLTDCGKIDDSIVKAMRGCHIAVVETNHQIELVENGPRPWVVKKWILSDDGHLNNGDAAALIRRISGPGCPLKEVLLAHISEDHNILEDLAGQMAEMIHNDDITLHLTYHHNRSAVLTIRLEGQTEMFIDGSF